MLGHTSTQKQSENTLKGVNMTTNQKILECIGCVLFMFSIISLTAITDGIEQTIIEQGE